MKSLIALINATTLGTAGIPANSSLVISDGTTFDAVSLGATSLASGSTAAQAQAFLTAQLGAQTLNSQPVTVMNGQTQTAIGLTSSIANAPLLSDCGFSTSPAVSGATADGLTDVFGNTLPTSSSASTSGTTSGTATTTTSSTDVLLAAGAGFLAGRMMK